MPATVGYHYDFNKRRRIGFFNFSQKLEVRFTNYKKIECVVFHRKFIPILQNCNTECSLRGMVTKMTKNSKKTQKNAKKRKKRKKTQKIAKNRKKSQKVAKFP